MRPEALVQLRAGGRGARRRAAERRRRRSGLMFAFMGVEPHRCLTWACVDASQRRRAAIALIMVPGAARQVLRGDPGAA